MTKQLKLVFGIGLAVVFVALLAGAALAQQGTPTPGTMMGGTAMPGRMMGGTPMPGSMMGGTAMPGTMMGGTPMPGRMMTGTMPNVMGQMMNDDMHDMMAQMMAGHGMTGTMSAGMGGMMGMMMQHMMGMMGGNGMMGNNDMMMGGGMMNGMSAGWSDPKAKPLTIDQVISATQQYLKNLPNNTGAGLAPLEIMEFSNGFYAAVGDKNGGAFEVLVDRYTGKVSPEPGPNMMWNTRYGMMGQGGLSGMMGGGMMGQGGMSGMMGNGMMGQGGGMMGLWTPPAAAPTVSVSQARTYAQQFLDLKFPGAKLPEDTLTFPGYYTLDFEVNGLPAGMLSVNGYTGQVWYHTWHGQFLSERMLSGKTM
jgi:hypothetical protein